jgi:hypothetical protein
VKPTSIKRIELQNSISSKLTRKGRKAFMPPQMAEKRTTIPETKYSGTEFCSRFFD